MGKLKKDNPNYNLDEFLNEIRIQIFRTTSRYYSLSKSIDLALKHNNRYPFVSNSFWNKLHCFFWEFDLKRLEKKTIYCEKRLNRVDEKIAVNDMWFLTDYHGLQILKKNL